MITLKNAQQIDKMHKAGLLLEQVLDALRARIEPGITTLELDCLAEKMIRDAGAIPSFKGYNGFPGSICASEDNVLIHGFPSKKPLHEGQILSVDCGLVLAGWQADSAFTSPVGEIPERTQELIRVTEECFWLGAAQAKEGNRLGDIANAIQEHAESHGFGVVRDYTGHGIGTQMHEDPSVPNYGRKGHGVRIRTGMTIAIEPMITMGSWEICLKNDGWGVLTADNSLCSHYEHTVAVTENGPKVLTCSRRMDP